MGYVIGAFHSVGVFVLLQRCSSQGTADIHNSGWPCCPGFSNTFFGDERCRSKDAEESKSPVYFWRDGDLNNVVPFCLIVWGQELVASGVASILNATTPLFTLVVAHFMTSDEKMMGGRLIGVVIGFLGIVIMIGTDVLAVMNSNLQAHLAILGASVSYAFAGIFGRRFKAMGITPLATATGQVTASSIFLIPMVILIDQPWTLPMPSLAALSSLFRIAVLSTALAYILYFRILATAGAVIFYWLPS